MILILADENIPRASIKSLRNAGLDVLSVAEKAPGISDSAVLEMARSESRLLLTFDRDFGELVYRRGHTAPPGIIYVRFAPTDPNEVAVVLRNVIEGGQVEFVGRLSVITRDSVRQRPLR